MNTRLLNLALFQLGWLICLYGGDGWALMCCVLLLLVHTRFVMTDTREVAIILCFTALGCAVDSLLSLAGVFLFDNDVLVIPLWLVCIWSLFATTLCHGFLWLRERLLLASLLGGVFGTASYVAGSKIAAVSFGMPFWLTVTVLALVWAMIFPLGVYFSGRYMKTEAINA